jgi:hypothetical protein
LLHVVPWEEDVVTGQDNLYGQRVSEKEQSIKRKEIESYVGSVNDKRLVRELKKGMNGYVYVKG